MIWSPPIKIFNEEQTMIYGYVRVSTDRQNVKNQHHEIKEFSKQKQLGNQHMDYRNDFIPQGT